LFPFFYLGCVMVIIVKFRQRPLSAIFGGVGFGLFVLSNASRLILRAAYDRWWQYEPCFLIAYLTGIIFIFVAILTAPVRRGNSDKLGTFETVEAGTKCDEHGNSVSASTTFGKSSMSSTKTLEARLRKLNLLKEKNLITEEEYQRKKNQLLNEA